MTLVGWKKAMCKRGHIVPKRNKSGGCLECYALGLLDKKAEYVRNKAVHIQKALAYAKQNPEARRDQQRAFRLGVSVKEVRTAIANERT